jgi:hypothetical protein
MSLWLFDGHEIQQEAPMAEGTALWFGAYGFEVLASVRGEVEAVWRYPGLTDTYREGTRSSLGRNPQCPVHIHRSSVNARLSSSA